MKSAAPGIEPFLSLNTRLAEYVLHVLSAVNDGKMKVKEGHDRVSQVELEIADHSGNVETRQVLFAPLRSLCLEIKKALIKKMS